jgi:hypothetical protein
VKDRFHNGWKAELSESIRKKGLSTGLQMNSNSTPRADLMESMMIMAFQDKLPVPGFGRVE